MTAWLLEHWLLAVAALAWVGAWLVMLLLLTKRRTLSIEIRDLEMEVEDLQRARQRLLHEIAILAVEHGE